jgi:hypothetical protein
MNLEISANPIAQPRPLDDEIARGVAIWGTVTADHLEALEARTSESFAELKSDQSREYGRCIAFAIEMIPVDEAEVDKTLIQTADEENHGTVTLYTDTGVEAVEGEVQAQAIWSGENKEYTMSLRKFVGHVFMEDSSIHKGIIYQLCAENKLAKAKESEDE